MSFYGVLRSSGWIMLVLALLGCQGSPTRELPDTAPPDFSGDYVIGPGDQLSIFVWRHPDLSTGVTVRPDGKISTPLVEDMVASGKTPTSLARDVETVLNEFVRSPTVTVIVRSFVGDPAQQIRIVGQAVQPRALQYRHGMTVLDAIIAVGGLSEYAAGNRAKIVRNSAGGQVELDVRLQDLLEGQRISENVGMQPGDILIIPESRF